MYTECINIQNKKYPSLLKEITDPPENIYCRGNIGLLQKHCITIVGTREPTEYGRRILEDFLSNIPNKEKYVFVSGLANGIDALVHVCCLKNNLNTIAVVAGGIDVGYPKSNEWIYDEICKKGLVISEYPEGTVIQKYMFPRRNRIMAGLSTTTILIQAKLKSGSLVTAQLALDYNRDVYVIPNSIYDLSSQGSNNLIQQGCEVILSREGFLENIQNVQLNMRV